MSKRNKLITYGVVKKDGAKHWLVCKGLSITAARRQLEDRRGLGQDVHLVEVYTTKKKVWYTHVPHLEVVSGNETSNQVSK